MGSDKMLRSQNPLSCSMPGHTCVGSRVVVVARHVIHLDEVPGLAVPAGVRARYDVAGAGRPADLALPVRADGRRGVGVA